MIYKDLKFSKPTQKQPFFYTSFVATADGKAYVNKNGYWPIGSRVDYNVFTYLRAHADAIIDGKNTAIRFGKNTIETINSESFKKTRKDLGKKGDPKYIVVTKHPDSELDKTLENNFGSSPVIFKEGIGELVEFCKKEEFENVFVDGGPSLLGSFFEKDLIDEIFLTIAPRIFGNSNNAAITMVEGTLLDPHKVKLELVSCQNFENEVFLRYRVIR